MNRPNQILLALALALPATAHAAPKPSGAPAKSSSGAINWMAGLAVAVAAFRVGHARKLHNALRDPKEPMF